VHSSPAGEPSRGRARPSAAGSTGDAREESIMIRHGFSLSAARAETRPLHGSFGLAVGSLAAGVLCLLLAAFAA